MTTFMGIIAGFVFIALLMVAGVAPRRSKHSRYQRDQLSDTQTASTSLELLREARLTDVLSLQRVTGALLLVTEVALLVGLLGWFTGIVVAVVVALEYGAIARLPLLQRSSQALYNRYEAKLLGVIMRYDWLFRVIRSSAPALDVESTVSSRDELTHIITQMKAVITPDEKALLLSGLAFGDQQVRDVMTPRGMIDSIDKKELLGPLVLDDLHKTGHSRFPVTDNDIDHVVGMLYVQNLMSLDSKKTTTAEKAMESRVFYIHEDQTLAHALAAFLRSHHLLFVVVNQYRETVGILSLEDTIEALIGRKITDEFDAHEDLRLVARRNPRGNNHTKNGQDV